jgi:methyltransferase family protein
MSRNWHEWHAPYADPASQLSRRAEVVRSRLAGILANAEGPVRLLSLCAGEGRDTLPVLATSTVPVDAVLVELDPELSATARIEAAALGLGGVEVRTADAGTTSCAEGAVPADVLMACGVFGNITEADLARTIATLPSLLAPGGYVIWTRGCRDEPVDPADTVRRVFDEAGYEEVDLVRPDDAWFRVGVHRWPGPAAPYLPGVRMFTFV